MLEAEGGVGLVLSSATAQPSALMIDLQPCLVGKAKLVAGEWHGMLRSAPASSLLTSLL